jgi:hypothetical protein
MSELAEISAIITHGGGIEGSTDLAASLICAFIRAVTASWACHMMLLIRSPSGSPFALACGPECVVEDGYTGLSDAITKEGPHVGVSATAWPIRRACLQSNWTEIFIGRVRADRVWAAYSRFQTAGFASQPSIWIKLALRTQQERPPRSELVCSTWAAAVLVDLGCLRESNLTWNAAPGDFLEHRLKFRCGLVTK